MKTLFTVDPEAGRFPFQKADSEFLVSVSFLERWFCDFSFSLEVLLYALFSPFYHKVLWWKFSYCSASEEFCLINSCCCNGSIYHSAQQSWVLDKMNCFRKSVVINWEQKKCLNIICKLVVSSFCFWSGNASLQMVWKIV